MNRKIIAFMKNLKETFFILGTFIYTAFFFFVGKFLVIDGLRININTHPHYTATIIFAAITSFIGGTLAAVFLKKKLSVVVTATLLALWQIGWYFFVTIFLFKGHDMSVDIDKQHIILTIISFIFVFAGWFVVKKLLIKMKFFHNKNFENTKVIFKSTFLFLFSVSIIFISFIAMYKMKISNNILFIILLFLPYLATAIYITLKSGENSVKNIIKTYILLTLIQMFLMYGLTALIIDKTNPSKELFLSSSGSISIIDTFFLYLMLSVPFIKNIYVKRKVKRNS